MQIGTGYTLATDVPIATFEDMTVAQTQGHAYPGWDDALGDAPSTSRMARQRRAYDQAVACCLTTPWAAESVIRDYGIAPAKVHVVGIGRNHAAPPASATGAPALPLRRHGLGAQERRRRAAGVRAPARGGPGPRAGRGGRPSAARRSPA